MKFFKTFTCALIMFMILVSCNTNNKFLKKKERSVHNSFYSRV